MRLALATLTLLSFPAFAEERPLIVPARDVDVTYRVGSPEADGPPLAQRMRWLVAASKLRVDPPTPGLYMIVDYKAHRMAMVKEADHAVLDVAIPASMLPGAGGSFAGRGSDSVTGLACRNWETADTAGQATTLCLTADGVMLRASQAGTPLLEAVAVAYAPQDPAAFIPPAGYRRVSPQLSPQSSPQSP